MDSKTPTGSSSRTNILDLARYKVKRKIEDSGLEWHEDNHGKIRLWIKLKKEHEKAEKVEKQLVIPDLSESRAKKGKLIHLHYL